MSIRKQFASRLRSGAELAGTFIKTRDTAIVEILAQTGFDYAVLDAEHAPMDRGTISDMALASRAARLPLIVRIPEAGGHWIASAIDAGAAGIMVPQVSDRLMAEQLVRAMRHGDGGLGFSPSTAGAEFGSRGIAGHLETHPEECVLVCQIESPSAVKQSGDIASVDGVDALLVGPVDLAIAAGTTNPGSDEIRKMCETAITAGKASNTSTGLFLGDPRDASRWRETGASLFVLGTDQSMLRTIATRNLDAFRAS